MDYAMLANRSRSDAAHLIEGEPADEVTSCPTVRSSSWYSPTFKTLAEERHLVFRTSWLERHRELGVSHVWLSIDDPNSDCHARGSNLAEFGMDKGRDRSETMVTSIEEVSAVDGRPVTYFASQEASLTARPSRRP